MKVGWQGQSHYQEGLLARAEFHYLKQFSLFDFLRRFYYQLFHQQQRNHQLKLPNQFLKYDFKFYSKLKQVSFNFKSYYLELQWTNCLQIVLIDSNFKSLHSFKLRLRIIYHLMNKMLNKKQLKQKKMGLGLFYQFCSNQYCDLVRYQQLKVVQ